jgi:NitT/TauT family transport system substrate-binding protein
MAWMEKHGADPSSVKWIEMPYAEMGAALTQGRIDAATVTEPFTTLDEAITRNIGAPYSAIAPSFMTVAWISSDSWPKAHPDLVQRFADVMRQTAVWANKHTAESGAILAKYSKMSPALVSRMARVGYAETLKASLVQPNIDLAVKFKLIDAEFPAADMIYTPSR